MGRIILGAVSGLQDCARDMLAWSASLIKSRATSDIPLEESVSRLQIVTHRQFSDLFAHGFAHHS